jgi:hypothetical protein
LQLKKSADVILASAIALLTGEKKAPCGEGLAISYKGE